MYEPNVKDIDQNINITQGLEKFITDLRSKVSQDDSDRSIWKTKLITAANQRLGIKRISDYPYENAPDIPLPETDKLIKKQVPNLVLSSWSVKKLCSVKVEEGIQKTPEMEQAAQRAEGAMNMILRDKCDLFNKLELAADYSKEKGHCIFKVVEDFKTRTVHKVIDLNDYPEEVIAQLKQSRNEELKMFLGQRYNLDTDDEDEAKTLKSIIEQFRSGEEIIEFDIEEVSSLPNIEIPLPDKTIVPSYTTDLAFAERITHEFCLTRHELEERFKTKIYREKKLDEIGFSKNDEDDIIVSQKKQAEGVQSSTAGEDLYRIQEIYTWYKPEASDCYERWVFTFLADIMAQEEALLRMIPFPFEFEGWNFERFDNERKDPRHYNSRGVPEQVRALQEVMERSINNMIIRDEHNNNPLYEVLDTSQILQRTTTFAPGELVPVTQLGAEFRRVDDKAIPDVSSMNSIRISKAFMEEYQASNDQLFNNATNVGGGKTLGEIERGIQKNQPALSQEIIRWNEALSKVYTKFHAIMSERLGDSLWLDGQQVTKEDFLIPSTVRSNGNLEMTNQEIASQKAWLRLQAVIGMRQQGVADIEDVYNAYRDWLEKEGVKDPEDFSTHPAQIMQSQLAQMEQQIQQAGMQLQQITEATGEAQKELSKTQKKTKDELKKFEGNMQAISQQ
jgi:flagellar biosynthesis chaperone FliJ